MVWASDLQLIDFLFDHGHGLDATDEAFFFALRLRTGAVVLEMVDDTLFAEKVLATASDAGGIGHCCKAQRANVLLGQCLVHKFEPSSFLGFGCGHRGRG